MMDSMWPELMLDLETMGTGSNAAIISIGAVAFNVELNRLGPEFYINVDLDSSVKAGGVITPSTVMWWMQQSDAARNVLLKDGVDVREALSKFTEFIKCETDGSDVVNVWGNGAGFDNVVLSSAYDRLGIKRPWNFRNDRCYRTMRSLVPNLEVPNIGTSHNALDDAKYQATYLLEVFNQLKGAAK